jgi:hypothetical protein
MACYVCGCAAEEHKDESGLCEGCPPGTCEGFDEDEEDDELEDKGGERYETTARLGADFGKELDAIEDQIVRVRAAIARVFPNNEDSRYTPQEGASR